MQQAMKRTLAMGLLIVVVLLSGYRIIKKYQPPGKFDASRQGFCDFHNGVYFPALAWRHGVSPYGATYEAEYPVDRAIPFFTPHIVALHIPLTFLPLTLAEVTYFLLCVGMVLAAARLLTRDVGRSEWWITCTLAVLFLVSRAGFVTLFTGYFTFELMLGTLVALRYGHSHPSLAAIGLMIAAGKPTYALPLGFLLMCRGHWRAVILGTALSCGLTLLSLGWLYVAQPKANDEGRLPSLSAFVESFLADIKSTQQTHVAAPTELAVNSWTRIDLLALVTKWTAPARSGMIQSSAIFEQEKRGGDAGTIASEEPSTLVHLGVMLLILLPSGVVLWLRGRIFDGAETQENQATGISAAMVILTLLICVYHQSTDTMLLVAPVAGLVWGNAMSWRHTERLGRWLLLGILMACLMNYFSTSSFLDRLNLTDVPHRIITSLAGIELFVVWVWVLAKCLRGRIPANSA